MPSESERSRASPCLGRNRSRPSPRRCRRRKRGTFLLFCVFPTDRKFDSAGGGGRLATHVGPPLRLFPPEVRRLWPNSRRHPGTPGARGPSTGNMGAVCPLIPAYSRPKLRMFRTGSWLPGQFGPARHKKPQTQFLIPSGPFSTPSSPDPAQFGPQLAEFGLLPGQSAPTSTSSRPS